MNARASSPAPEAAGGRPKAPRTPALLYLAILVALVVVYGWSFSGVETNPRRLLEGLGETLVIFRLMFFPPAWYYLHDVAIGVVETLQIAVLGTCIAAVLALPFGFWAARNVAGKGIPAASGKLGLNAIRTFPELLLAVIFIRWVGPGPFAGVLAMGFHSVGMLGKLYAEVVEAIDPAPVEALVATGANRLQVAWYAILPQVLPDFASYALYRFEINSRAAAVLGLVGAGGIGTPLIFNLQQHNWPEVGMILLGVIVVVSVIDYVSGYLRRRIV